MVLTKITVKFRQNTPYAPFLSFTNCAMFIEQISDRWQESANFLLC